MDELAEQLSTSFAVSNDPNSTAAQHPRFAQYKSRSSSVDQDARRRRILEAQKKQRFDFQNHARCLSEDTWDNTDAESVASNDSMEIETDGEKVKLHKPGKYYKNQLMLSEWLVEVPSDFEEEWRMVICPWGKRCLVVSARGKTHAYTRSGYRINTFSSALPGGNKTSTGGRYKDNAIIDCIYNELLQTFFILDVMSWKNHPIYDSETEFRFYWLASKIAEEPELTTKSELNPYKFIPLANLPCTKTAIGEAIASAEVEIDGLLFYHKRTHYTFGSTPLVVWLKPYMVPEILDIQVPDKIMGQKPDSYVNYAQHMKNVAEEKEKARELRGKGQKKKGPIKIMQREKSDKTADTVEMKDEAVAAKDGTGASVDSTGDHVKKSKNRRWRGGRTQQMDVMFSVWMTDVPKDLSKNWLSLVCPKGKRNLVIAARGRTFTQTKQGRLLDDFSSVLPGGFAGDRDNMTVLDCIHDKKKDIYYVLDVLFWKAQDLSDCDSEFRLYWLKERMGDLKSIGKITRSNEHVFKVVKACPSFKKRIADAVARADYEIDGILFYNKKIVYTAGESRDVLWLKPYMLPEAIGVDISAELLETKPRNYTTFEDHVAQVKEEMGDPEPPKGRRGGQKQRATIDIDKITYEISNMFINKRESEQMFGPALAGREGQASIWQSNSEATGWRSNTTGRLKPTINDRPGLLGHPWEYEIYGDQNPGGSLDYVAPEYQMGYKQGMQQRHMDYQQGAGQYYGPRGWGDLQGQQGMYGVGGMGFQGQGVPKKPAGRGGLLSTIDSYKKTHKAFKE